MFRVLWTRTLRRAKLLCYPLGKPNGPNSSSFQGNALQPKENVSDPFPKLANVKPISKHVLYIYINMCVYYMCVCICIYIYIYSRASHMGDVTRVMYSSVSVGVVHVLCACAQVRSTV